MTLLWRKVLECSSSHCSLRHPCVLTHSYGGRFWSVLPHCSLRHPCDLTLMEEGSGVFFLTLLTSSSLCPHSYGGRFWSVLPHCSLRHPCDLTLMEEGSGVFFLTLLTSSSLCPHSLRHPCVLTPITCLLTHLIVIPDFSLESSHPSHP